MWRENVATGIYPVLGGWEDQPLNLLVIFSALNTMDVTWQNHLDEKFDMGKFTRTQRELIHWVEKELMDA